ncbi:MAG: thiamine ABC transporter substrate-binding protein, partial [Candidatus Cloacimonadaceae bacterium]|nr:thiamine ABC transporter substrate-binding protein [Candidatus Cloacimonadaceae bacterium]
MTIPDFMEKQGITVVVEGVEDSKALLEKIAEDGAAYDLVIGIANTLAMSSDYESLFETLAFELFENLNREVLVDRKNKLVPYAYGYYSLLYNSALIGEPPESFGELQDPRFYNQLALVAPDTDEIGRGLLYWTVALFGEEGYQHLWRALRKNVLRTYPTWKESFTALENGTCALAFGFSTTPNWYLENQQNQVPIKASMLKEGSYIYIESAAIPVSSQNKRVAVSFLEHFLNPETQQQVIFKLGLMPANTKTFLPMHFT